MKRNADRRVAVAHVAESVALLADELSRLAADHPELDAVRVASVPLMAATVRELVKELRS